MHHFTMYIVDHRSIYWRLLTVFTVQSVHPNGDPHQRAQHGLIGKPPKSGDLQGILPPGPVG